MKHYTKWSWCPYERKWLCRYVDLTEKHWFDTITKHTVYADGEEPPLLRVEVKYHSRDLGRTTWDGKKYWEPAGIYSIAKEDKKELHRLLKVWFQNCEFRYSYGWRAKG